MAQRIKGKCKYCGKEYTLSYMNRHLSSCKERQERLAAEKGSKRCGFIFAGYLVGVLWSSECIYYRWHQL